MKPESFSPSQLSKERDGRSGRDHRRHTEQIREDNERQGVRAAGKPRRRPAGDERGLAERTDEEHEEQEKFWLRR